MPSSDITYRGYTIAPTPHKFNSNCVTIHFAGGMGWKSAPCIEFAKREIDKREDAPQATEFRKAARFLYELLTSDATAELGATAEDWERVQEIGALVGLKGGQLRMNIAKLIRLEETPAELREVAQQLERAVKARENLLEQETDYAPETPEAAELVAQYNELQDEIDRLTGKLLRLLGS